MEIEMTDQTTRLPIRRALISVSDKTGILDFARELEALGVEILSTGGTFKLLQDNGVAAVEVADYTGFAEMMDGRVKTLHPKIHGGILGRRGIDDDIMNEHGIKPIDLVAVNLYPFEATINKPGCDLPTAIENIDIGGPTMVRSAAKNHKDVAIVVNAGDYANVLENLKAGGLHLPDPCPGQQGRSRLVADRRGGTGPDRHRGVLRAPRLAAWRRAFVGRTDTTQHHHRFLPDRLIAGG